MQLGGPRSRIQAFSPHRVTGKKVHGIISMREGGSTGGEEVEVM